MRVSISVPLFTEVEKERFLEALSKQEALTIRLIKQDLPNELRAIAEKQGLKLFPESWRDFSMHCSCDDYSTPCEHLSAVIYEIAEEIDKNPFLLFELHEMNLMRELDAFYQKQESKKMESVAVLNDLLDPPPAQGHFINEAGMKLSKPLKPQALDFTTIPEAGTQLLMLFRANEFFDGIEIKEVLHQCYADASEVADQLLRGDAPEETLPFRIQPEDHLQLVFDENLLFKTLLLRDISGRQRQLTDFKPEDLVQLLYTYDFKTLNRTHPNTLVLLHIFSFALNIAKNGTIAPQLLECVPGRYRVRWLPALAVEEVRELFEKLAPSLAPDFIVVERKGVKRTQPAAEMLKTISSFFLGHFVAAKAETDDRPLVQLFQNTAEPPLQKLESPEFAERIHRWLNNYYITKKDYVPVVKVEEVKGQYQVELMVHYVPTPLMPPIPLDVFLQQKKYEAVRVDVMKDMELLLEFFPQLSLALESEGRKKLSYNPTRFMEVLLRNLPAIELFGMKTLLPPGMKEYVRPQLSLLVNKFIKTKKSAQELPFDKQFSFEWQMALGDTVISVEEFEELVSSVDGVVYLGGRYVLVDEDQLIHLSEKLDEKPNFNSFESLHILFTERYKGAGVRFTPEAEAHLKEFLAPREFPLPKRLGYELTPYQLTGYDYLMKNARHGYGTVLADDIGLGKASQVIAMLLKFKDEGLLEQDKLLVIVPTPLLANWQRKMRLLAPTLVTAVYYGKKRPLGVSSPDVIITSFDTASDEVELLKKMPWHCIVVDEAQWIGDPTSEVTQNVKALPAQLRIAIINRQIENSLGDLWSIMDFVNPGYLGSPTKFMHQFEHPILREHDQRRSALFTKIVAPFMLRRMKTDKDIISELPAKIETDLYASLSPEQHELYHNLVQRDLKLALTETDANRRQTIVLSLIRDLRKICNHPYQYTRGGSKMPELSGKMELLVELLDNSYANGLKTMVFTQFPETGDILVKAIKDIFGKEPLYIHSSMGMAQQDEMVFNFQRNPVFDTLVLATTPTTAGLNLTAANNVVLFDRVWNPKLESQMVDRNCSTVPPKIAMHWRLATAGTFEERLDELLRTEKDQITAAVGENWIGALSVQDLEWLFS